MVVRLAWRDRVEAAWRSRSIVWLTGVRRAGKTSLCRSLDGVEYFDCELPRTRQELADPESFLAARPGRRVVLDEIHRLDQPSELLKIAADHFPTVRIVATGSSTLGASARFRDTLAGRKHELWLTPMTVADLGDFGSTDIRHRLLRGGLPPFWLADQLPERDFQEWVDAYWAKDVLELFRLERRRSFQGLFELLLRQSGGMFEASALARPLEISRTTVSNYLAVLEETMVMHVVRPFAAGGAAEIVSAPRVYGFDTGFVAYYCGWHPPRREDLGVLWEHLVLNELHAALGRPIVRYWRTKSGREVDFVVDEPGRAPDLVECKWTLDAFEPDSMKAFRARYPEGRNVVVAGDARSPFTKRFGALTVRVLPIGDVAASYERPVSPPAGRRARPRRT
jgi:predicted AAA+ superfamily ATPase